MPNGGTASLGIILVDDLAAAVSIGATVQISEITITGQSGDGAAPTDTTPTTVPDPGGRDDSFVEPSPGFVPPPAASTTPPLETPDRRGAAAHRRPRPSPRPAAAAPGLVRRARASPGGGSSSSCPLALGMGFATVYGRRLLEARGVSFSS